MPDLTSEQLLDRLRQTVRTGLRVYTEAEQSYPRVGDGELDRVGLLASRVGALHNTLAEVAELLGVEPNGGAS